VKRQIIMSERSAFELLNSVTTEVENSDPHFSQNPRPGTIQGLARHLRTGKSSGQPVHHPTDEDLPVGTPAGRPALRIFDEDAGSRLSLLAQAATISSTVDLIGPGRLAGRD
jgi:hypothetical protein